MVQRRVIRLGVNIDHVATLRQQRKETYPDVLQAARTVKGAGAQSITVHLREDRRHIQEKDVVAIGKYAGIRLNLEMAATPWMVRFACRLKPDSACLVPEKRKELTTEGGLDVARSLKLLKSKVRRLKKAGIKVSLFIDPAVQQVRASCDAGADAVELHTGAYAGARSARFLEKLRRAAESAGRLGLNVHAGHGLDYENIGPVLNLPHLEELNIGFSIVSRAVFVGLEKAVKEMLLLMR